MSSRTRTGWRWVAVVAVLALTAGFAPAIAEEEAPGEIATVWMFWVEPEHQAAFEAGLKAHAAWRKSAGEGVEWHIYQPVVGSDLDYYIVRSGGHHWKDLDAIEEWQVATGAVAKYMEQVGAHVDRSEHYLARSDFQHSKWEMSEDYRYFGVSSLKVAPGAYGKMTEALDKVHKAATEKKWPRSYAISWMIGGEGRMTVVTPFKSYAEMAEPDPPFMKLMADSLGSEAAAKETMQQLQSSFQDSTYSIYAFRKDLSTPK
jgi:hypothetical protein